jgi:hypothetical protein
MGRMPKAPGHAMPFSLEESAPITGELNTFFDQRSQALRKGRFAAPPSKLAYAW